MKPQVQVQKGPSVRLLVSRTSKSCWHPARKPELQQSTRGIFVNLVKIIKIIIIKGLKGAVELF